MFNYNNFLNNSFSFTFYYGKVLAPRDVDCILVPWLVHSITTEFQASPGIMLSNLKVLFSVFFCKTCLLALA